MTHYEYKVVPAPRRGERVKGVKAAEDRFAIALTNVMNTHAAQGWEYQRTETLPAEEREGLMGKATVFQNMMVFRRLHATTAADHAPDMPMIEDKRATQESPVTPERPDDAPAADPATARPHPVFSAPPLTAAAPPVTAPVVAAPSVTASGDETVPGPTVTEDDRR
ncbi:DUF4177 domain-containing protein [Loktanella sp. M215]|uniref:DUF4177 domain-containing protein n=1 Tax=Loktanella sp. M215 TaxID=2675431 RepID=UPI001F2BA457|nr:DUF4177 domain-containing protein [Loktanella sp. M215]MCF7699788.1 DUF4177 domain-containing protein [Loktanella sp. M215]